MGIGVDNVTGRARIVIIGGSFGSLSAAFTLRRKLDPERAEITLLSREENFTFVPSLTWVAVGSRRLSQISIGLSAPLAGKQVAFVNDAVIAIDTEKKTVTTANREFSYDFLIIATGHRSANEAVEGLGPFTGPGHSPMSAPEAEELATAVQGLLRNPAPVLVGAAPGASCIGPAYELAFGIDYLLRKKKLRHLVPMTFVTPEPYLGHMGMGGAGKIRQLLEGALEERDISYRTSAAIKRITPGGIDIEGETPIESQLSIVIPPLAGVDVVAKTPQLSNPKGFIVVDEHFRHKVAEGVYAIGVAVALPPAESTPVPVNFPKTGHMTEQMATIAAQDLVGEILGSKRAPSAELSARCVLDMGDRGIYLSADPVRPPRNRIPTVSEGRQWLLVKRAFERTYLWHTAHGRKVPTTFGW